MSRLHCIAFWGPCHSHHLPDLGHVVLQEAVFLPLSLWRLLISNPHSTSKLHCTASIPACSIQLYEQADLRTRVPRRLRFSCLCCPLPEVPYISFTAILWPIFDCILLCCSINRCSATGTIQCSIICTHAHMHNAVTPHTLLSPCSHCSGVQLVIGPKQSHDPIVINVACHMTQTGQTPWHVAAILAAA